MSSCSPGGSCRAWSAVPRCEGCLCSPRAATSDWVRTPPVRCSPGSDSRTACKMTLLQFLRDLHEAGSWARAERQGRRQLWRQWRRKTAAERKVLRSHLLMQRFLRCLRFHRPAVASALPRGLLLRGLRHFFTRTGAAMYLTAASEKIGSKLRRKAADCPERCGTCQLSGKIG